uniref:Uncharacterized protein n=1 Tax=Aegilops tauschii subsp. strangulata TaxID=200361 RepID=A0A453JHW4_AEGTS
MDYVILFVMYRWSNICAMPLTLVVICIVLLWSITCENPFTGPRCTFLLIPATILASCPA